MTQIGYAIQKAWCRRTSYYPMRWGLDNPALGQCAVTALLVQAMMGGDIVCIEYGRKQRHYYNLIDGAAIDYTIMQFDKTPRIKREFKVEREQLLKNCRERYELLRTRFVGMNKETVI